MTLNISKVEHAVLLQISYWSSAEIAAHEKKKGNRDVWNFHSNYCSCSGCFEYAFRLRGLGKKQAVRAHLFLNGHQDRLVSEIAEMIIPVTDSPGAKEARVNEFIDLMLADCYYETDQRSFIEGLERMEKACLHQFDRSFLEASIEQRTILLKKEARPEKDPDNATRFFQIVKELTLLGYFTSKVGATQALAYRPIPGKFEGCIPLAKGQKGWAV